MAGSNTVKGVLSELAKRVPKNQLPQLKNFLELHAKYNNRVNKYPAKLPTIDWDYYRTNVRIEAIKMVDEFEKKYEELNKIFDDRVKLDTKKYFVELEKQRTVVQAEVNQYIAESNKRIKAYEAEMERLRLMKPYSSMTMEEYISLRPEHADCIPHRRKPLFWPHDPDEQIPGPVGIKKPDDDGGGHPVKPSDFKGKTEASVFNAGDAKAKKSMPIADSVEPRPAQPQPVEVEATKAPHVSKPSTDNVDEPAPEEVKRKLNPCNLIEKESKKVEVEQAMTSVQASAAASSKPTERVEVKSNGNKVEQQKKVDPCDMVKKEKKKEPLAEDIDPCAVAPKGSYKDVKKDSCVLLDPCQLKFGAGANSEAKSETQTTPEKKAATKPEKKEPQKVPKNPHPCDLIKKKAEEEKDACKNAPNGPYKNGKADSCVYMDPRKAGHGAGSKSADKKSDSCALQDPCKSGAKATDSKTAMTKPEAKSAASWQSVVPKENKLSQPCTEPKKSKVVECESEDGKKDVSSKVRENKRGDTCARTPYYNPFRSEEENIKQNEEACDECKEEDPCKSDKRSPKTPYYNLFKDDKE